MQYLALPDNEESNCPGCTAVPRPARQSEGDTPALLDAGNFSFDNGVPLSINEVSNCIELSNISCFKVLTRCNFTDLVKHHIYIFPSYFGSAIRQENE
jgi:hypothetical protein